MSDKRTPADWARLAMEAAKAAFASRIADNIDERERKMALAIEDRFGGVVDYCRKQRERYGEDAALDAALADVDK